ncbi:hypothetical protein ABKN59_009247 [Abortiporus biennis]
MMFSFMNTSIFKHKLLLTMIITIVITSQLTVAFPVISEKPAEIGSLQKRTPLTPVEKFLELARAKGSRLFVEYMAVTLVNEPFPEPNPNDKTEMVSYGKFWDIVKRRPSMRVEDSLVHSTMKKAKQGISKAFQSLGGSGKAKIWETHALELIEQCDKVVSYVIGRADKAEYTISLEKAFGIAWQTNHFLNPGLLTKQPLRFPHDSHNPRLFWYILQVQGDGGSRTLVSDVERIVDKEVAALKAKYAPK